MITSPYATKKTREIHALYLLHDTAVANNLARNVECDYEHNRRSLPSRRPHKGSCTQPPRQREGLNKKLRHNVYPGGKHLRKALRRLHDRREPTVVGMTNWDNFDVTKPGSMVK